MLSSTEGATYVKPWGEMLGQLMFSVRHSLATIPALVPTVLGSRGPYQEGLISALTEGRVVWAVYWRLPCEAGVKLTHIFL